VKARVERTLQQMRGVRGDEPIPQPEGADLARFKQTIQYFTKSYLTDMKSKKDKRIKEIWADFGRPGSKFSITLPMRKRCSVSVMYVGRMLKYVSVCLTSRRCPPQSKQYGNAHAESSE
jgi:hypothetical protein